VSKGRSLQPLLCFLQDCIKSAAKYIQQPLSMIHSQIWKPRALYHFFDKQEPTNIFDINNRTINLEITNFIKNHSLQFTWLPKFSIWRFSPPKDLTCDSKFAIFSIGHKFILFFTTLITPYRTNWLYGSTTSTSSVKRTM
jgi:hypothetical protein